MIFKHKDGGWYQTLYKGKFKVPETGEWIDVVQYQRLAVDLKPNEDTNTLYCRTIENFKENFTHYGLRTFEHETGLRITSQDFFKQAPPKEIRHTDIYGEEKKDL